MGCGRLAGVLALLISLIFACPKGSVLVSIEFVQAQALNLLCPAIDSLF